MNGQPEEQTRPLPNEIMKDNISEVRRLISIHEKVTGPGPGHKSNVEVLNKSAIVLLVACWEAFVEDLAQQAFEILVTKARDHNVFPSKVLVASVKKLKADKDDRAIWKIAGDGWKKILQHHREEVIKEHCGKFNTPKPEQVNLLFEVLLGIRKLSSNWHWPGVDVKKSKEKLVELVELRGEIAHRVKAGRAVYKKQVREYMKFINRIAMSTSNATGKHLFDLLGEHPWPQYKWGPSEDTQSNHA